MLSRTYEQRDCVLDVASEAASDSSGEYEIDKAFSSALLVDAVETDEVLLAFLLLSLTVDKVCPGEIVGCSRCSKELCLLLHVVHDLDLQFLLEWPDLKKLTHNLCF